MNLILVCLGSIYFTGLTGAVSISPNGLPVGYPPPVNRSRNRTDFTAIFSAISSGRARSTRSTGTVISSRDDAPPDPTFFELAFGPTDGASSADGFMGVVFLDSYNVSGCAQQCNTRAFDATSGPCIFFNIWTGVDNGTVVSNVCSLYNTVADASTATNTGQGTLTIAASRGYSRISLIQDGSFQDYTCILGQGHACPVEPSAFWIRVFHANWDFILVNNFPGHSGTSAANFFFNPSEQPNNTTPAIPSTLTYTQPLNAVAGSTYVLSFFYTPSHLTLQPGDQDPLFSAWWNGVDVIDVLTPADTVDSSTYLNAMVQITANGSDALFFQNGPAGPHQLFLDDIAVFEKWF